MDQYSMGKLIGVVVGIVVGLIIALVVLKFMNKDKKVRTEYDEMQKQIRNKGYFYAFYTVLVYEAILAVLSIAVELPVHPIVLHFGAIFVGVVVQASYSIWKDAYVGLNTNMKRFLIFAVIISLFNLFIFFMNWKEGEAIADGILQPAWVNLFCGLMFAVLGAVAVVKKLAVREVEE